MLYCILISSNSETPGEIHDLMFAKSHPSETEPQC